MQNTYINPAAFRPQGGGLFSQGYDYATDRGIYEKMMQEQAILQQLAVQKAQQEQKEFMSGAPLRDQKQQLEAARVRGELPYAEQAAGEGLLAQTAQNQYNRKAMHGPEAIQAKLQEYKGKASDAEWTNLQRRSSATAHIAQNALDIQKTQSEQAAQAYVQEQKQLYSRAGINLPSSIDSPGAWPQIAERAKMTVEHMQALQLRKEQDDAAERRTRIQANATVQAARESSGHLRNANIEQEIVNLQRKEAAGSITPTEKAHLQRLLQIKWQMISRSDPSLIILRQRAMDVKNPEAAQAAAAQLRQIEASVLGTSPSPAPANPGTAQPSNEVNWNDYRPQAK